MGVQEWSDRERYYDGLKLHEEGDPLEQHAAIVRGLDLSFPNYERFWRRHVVPSSHRPHEPRYGFRPRADVAIRYISQISYSLLHNFVQAKRLEATVRQKDYGFHLANIQSLVLFTGNALQLLLELREEIDGRLFKLLNEQSTIVPKSDWEQVWSPRFERISRYRNYLTHRGLILVCWREINEFHEPHLLSRDKVHSQWKKKNSPLPTAWEYEDDGLDPNSSDFVRFDLAAIEMLEQSISFANDFYEQICNRLDPFVTMDVYQKAWGW